MAEWNFFKRKQASCCFNDGWAVVAHIMSPSGDEHESELALVSQERLADVLIADLTGLSPQLGFVEGKHYWLGMTEDEQFDIPEETPNIEGDKQEWESGRRYHIGDLYPKPMPPSKEERKLDLDDPELPF